MCCLELLCCCFGPAACGLCCGWKVKSSLTTRLLYLPFLLFIVILSAVMLSPTVRDALTNVSYNPCKRDYLCWKDCGYYKPVLSFSALQSILCAGYTTDPVDVDPIECV